MLDAADAREILTEEEIELILEQLKQVEPEKHT
jgi:hypothetical protein